MEHRQEVTESSLHSVQTHLSTELGYFDGDCPQKQVEDLKM